MFLILHFFDKALLGQYALSLMIITMPTVLFTSSVLEAFSPRVAMAKYEGKHAELLLKVNKRITSFTIFPFMVLAINGDILFQFIFGENWTEAGVILQIMSLRAFFEIIFTPAISLINIIIAFN